MQTYFSLDTDRMIHLWLYVEYSKKQKNKLKLFCENKFLFELFFFTKKQANKYR